MTIVWEFHEAPKELQVPFNGGDEDFIVATPLDFIPWQLEGLGCCTNDNYQVSTDGVICRARNVENVETGNHERVLEPTELRAPAFKGWRFIVSCHA